MPLFIKISFSILGLVSWAVSTVPALAQGNALNLYSSRHYETDEALYANFTKLTGIKVNRIEANENALLEFVPAGRFIFSDKLSDYVGWITSRGLNL